MEDIIFNIPNILNYESKNDMENPDELVLKGVGYFRLILDYPFFRVITISKMFPIEGIHKHEIAGLIVKIFRKKYEIEKSALDFPIFGIWGKSLEDISLHKITYNVVKNYWKLIF